MISVWVGVGAIAVLFLLYVLYGYVYRLLTTPQQWTAIHQRIPQVVIDQQQVQIQYIRDFEYDRQGKIKRQRYFDARYDIDCVEKVWCCITHFARPGIAHVLLSFEFTDGRFLALSVEARCQSRQRYHPLKGLFFIYPKLMLFGSEQDLIGLRYLHLKHKTYLYPLNLTMQGRRHLFAAIAQQAQQQQNNMQRYHSIFNNCLTSLAKYTKLWHWSRSMWDYRILLPGYCDALALQTGLMQADSLAQLRQQALIEPNIITEIDKQFSCLLRKNYL